MTTPTGPPSLVPPKTNYQDYFSRSETNTFHFQCASLLVPCVIDLVAAAAYPADVVQIIYAAVQ